MKQNVLFLLILFFIFSITLQAQRGVRIGYIDTEYILENVPEYQEASKQLNEKANKWKSDIDFKLSAIQQKRKDLSNEKALLTAELIEEREEDIAFEEYEILDYQQKRFGPNGDLFIQKKQLMQPIQDQIFAAVQDLAASKKYDFILDKSSDAIMLYSAKQFDLSETVIRSLTRTSKRTQAETKAERKAAEAEDLVPESDDVKSREKILEEKKAAREAAFEKRRQDIINAREARKLEAEANRQKAIEDREGGNKQENVDSMSLIESKNTETEKTDNKATETKPDENTKTQAQLIEENKQKKLAEREQRKKEFEERKQKIIEERQKAKDSLNNN